MGKARTPPLAHAKLLRQRQTDAERRLWYHLRAHRFQGLKFKRQKPVGPFVADFVCLERNLVIEVDGGQHGEHRHYDRRRDTWFAAQGMTVLRCWNNEVLGDTEAVLEKIRQALSPGPSPGTGRGERPKEPSPLTPLPQAGEGSES
jgi:very-short-patch-repair endonuclease